MKEGDRSLSHLGPDGTARMVDIGDKPVTDRRAEARGAIRMQPGTLEVVSRGEARKGDVLGVARVAGIMAAKRTSELIPLCHPLTLDDVRVEIEVERSLPGLRVTASVRTTGRTGAEMEALTAVAVTLLTIYDMTKSVDREMVITDIVLAAKSGGVRHD